MPNIKFNYCYRDHANYKNYNSVIFSNPQDIELDAIQHVMSSKLIDETYFYANRWSIPNLIFPNLDLNLDPTWHEFESVEYTTENSTTTHNLTEFIQTIKLSPI